MTAGDISQRMLDNAGTLLREEGFELETALFPAEKIPFADATFGLVAARVAPHHFSSPERFVAEAARVLAPGGHFLLIDGSVPDADPEDVYKRQAHANPERARRRPFSAGSGGCP